MLKIDKDRQGNRPISLAIYLPDFSAGGAERVNISLATALGDFGFDVNFVVHKKEGGLLATIPPGIRIESLDVGRTLAALIPLVRFLRREKPDILLSSFGHNNIIAIISTILSRSPTRIVVVQHNSLSGEKQSRKWQWRVVPSLYRLLLGRANEIVAVSTGVGDEIAEFAQIPRERITVINNPVIGLDFDQRISDGADHPWMKDTVPFILGVGRLVEQKGFDTLLAAFALLVPQRNLRLIVLGEGVERTALESEATRLGIGERVSFPGFVLNPQPFMRKAAAFVLSSRYEGFGNALVEALACGTPVVSTTCKFGPQEILDEGNYGRLVPVGDSVAMAKAIAQTLDNPISSREAAQARGREFGVARATEAYAELFLASIAKNRT